MTLAINRPVIQRSATGLMLTKSQRDATRCTSCTHRADDHRATPVGTYCRACRLEWDQHVRPKSSICTREAQHVSASPVPLASRL